MERTIQLSNKLHQVSDEGRNMGSIDRLSALPDEVICHILSFLMTKDSVKTSILGKRWRNMWAHVPIVELDSDFHFSRSTTMRPTFSNSINTIMSLHKVQSLISFRLHHSNGYPYVQCSANEFQKCIATAIERNVQILDLSLNVELPQCLLTCKTLVDLRLRGCVGIPTSDAISLPRLKKLHLDDVLKLFDLPHLLSGCPVLEELIINGEPEHRLPGWCNISSPTLIKLTIDFICDSYAFENDPDYMVKINAPALRYLEVRDCSYEQISVSSTASLIEADIGVCVADDSVYHRGVSKFLDTLRNVKCLRLSSNYEFLPDSGVAGLSLRFDKLTDLELSADWRFLTKFLEIAHHLEVLIIYEGSNDWKNWMEPVEERSACLLYSLRTVTIHHFKCTEQGFNMVRYILKNAQVLKRMKIYPWCHGIDLKAKFDALQRISLFGRGSKECELAFY